MIPDIYEKRAGLVILEHGPDSTVLASLLVCLSLGRILAALSKVMEINLQCIWSVFVVVPASCICRLTHRSTAILPVLAGEQQ